MAAPRTPQLETLKGRIARLLERLDQGGEVAQGVVRELFPGGIWLYPDPNGGSFLWARAQTALPTDWRKHVDASGRLPAQHWPRVYNVIDEEPRKDVRLSFRTHR